MGSKLAFPPERIAFVSFFSMVCFHASFVLFLTAGCTHLNPPAASAANPRLSVRADCCMSFRDLHRLARKRDWTAEEAHYFQSVDQPTRNNLVKQLAHEAGCIRTEDRIGTDGQIYTAFWLDRAVCGASGTP